MTWIKFLISFWVVVACILYFVAPSLLVMLGIPVILGVVFVLLGTRFGWI